MRAGPSAYEASFFSGKSKRTLREIALRLRPHEDAIVSRWVSMQLRAYRPPRISADEVGMIFGRLVRRMIALLGDEKPDVFIAELYEQGAELAARDFPYEALIMSVHFLEESYMPYLIESDQRLTRERFVWMDEFMHLALGALATSYFRAFRDTLLGRAEAGRIIQEGLSPNIPGRVADLEVGYVYQSATREALVGGDVVDVFGLDDGRAAFLVGDVAGHGVAAAKDGASLRSLFRGLLRGGASLVETVEWLNRSLYAELGPGSFITAVFGVCEPGGAAHIVNAGHPPLVVRGRDPREAEPAGLLLGVVPEAEYEAHELLLEPGDMLVAYTDGLTEARGSQGFFGEGRVAGTLAEERDATPQAAVDRLRAALLEFSGGELEDDVAILALLRRPSE